MGASCLYSVLPFFDQPIITSLSLLLKNLGYPFGDEEISTVASLKVEEPRSLSKTLLKSLTYSFSSATESWCSPQPPSEAVALGVLQRLEWHPCPVRAGLLLSQASNEALSNPPSSSHYANPCYVALRQDQDQVRRFLENRLKNIIYILKNIRTPHCTEPDAFSFARRLPAIAMPSLGLMCLFKSDRVLVR